MQLASLTVTDARLRLAGGSPSGRDDVHATVSAWPGWRRMPGTYSLDGQLVSSYIAAITPTALFAAQACKTIQIRWSDDAAALLVDWQRRMAVLRDAIESRGTTPAAAPWPTLRQPRPHQLAALRALEALEWRALLADDMGLGKTATALWAAWSAQARHILVVCPVSVKWNWQREISETLGDAWSATVLDGSSKARADQLLSIANPLPHTALIFNYDMVRTFSDSQLAMVSYFAARSFVVLDESHYIKSREAARTTLVVQRIASRANEGLLLLSGTPIRNFVNDIFTQVEALRPGTWVSYHDFCERHLDMRIIVHGKRKTVVPARSKRLKDLNAVINTLQIRRLKEECISLPPKIITEPELTMDASMRTVYTAMRDYSRFELGELLKEHGEDTAIWHPAVRTGATNAMMRCEQIAQGFVGGLPEPVITKVGKVMLKQAEKIEGRPNEMMFPDFAKVVWIIEAIDAIRNQGGQPVVFSRFNGPLFWLARKLPYKLGILHGAISAQQKDSVVCDFQNNITNVLLCQVRMAEGFNLVSSQDVIFWGRDWSPAVNAQAEDRCHRMGQTGTVNIQVPIVRGTVDIFLDRKLKAKESDANNALAQTTLGELYESL